jgi:arylsulfatase A-like enzyme
MKPYFGDEVRGSRAPLGPAPVVMCGVASGTLLALFAALVEVFALPGGGRAGWGLSLAQVLAVYAALGAGIGLLAGTWWSGRRGVRRSVLRAFAVTGATAGWIVTVLVLLRVRGFPGSAASAADLVARVLIAALPWALAALWALRRAPGRGARKQRWLPALGATVAIVVLAVLALGGQRGARHIPRREVPARAPNLVLIVVDGLRADRMGAYGYARATSPSMDRAAAEGALFTRAYAHGTGTAASILALLTSLYPSEHGAVRVDEVVRSLPPERLTIAENLRARGYAAVGLLSDPVLADPLGAERGFDRVERFGTRHRRLAVFRALESVGILGESPRLPGGGPRAEEVTRCAQSWIQRLRDRPFFLYVHYADVQPPYAPEPFAARRLDAVLDPSRVGALFESTARLLEGPRPIPMADSLRACLSNLYDATVATVDVHVGSLLDAIRGERAERPTVVVLTSSRGCELLEHGSLFDTNGVVEELIRVPLVVWRSDHAWPPSRIDGLARHVDVLPTLADLAGAAPPSEARGVSLAACARDGGAAPAAASIAEGNHTTALVTPAWKLVLVDTTAAYFLYDLGRDPAGMTDVGARHPAVVDTLRAALETYRSRAAAAAARPSGVP